MSSTADSLGFTTAGVPVLGTTAPNVWTGSSVLHSPLVKPVSANFTSTGVFTSITDNSDRLTVVIAAAANSLRILTQTIPSPPYTIDVGGSMNSVGSSSITTGLGVALFDGTKARTAWMGQAGVPPTFEVLSWTTIASPTLVASPLCPLVSPIWFTRLTDDGITRKFYVSFNGKDFALFLSELTNTFLTPTKVGVSVYSDATGNSAKASIFHYVVTSSILGDDP